MGLACAALGWARPVAAQDPGGPCNLYFDNTDTSRSHSIKQPSTKYNTFIGGGVNAHCTNKRGVRLKSDSAEFYDDQGLLYLFGHVHYTDPRAIIDAHYMTYYVATERLLADTDVVAVMPSGTTMHGPHADYLRQIPNVRPRAQLTAPGRPHFHLVQRDSTSTASDTAGVDADLVYMNGDSLVYASRNVVVKRTDLTATGDSAFMNQGTGFLELMIKPVIQGTQQNHPFTLKGDLIDVYTVNHQLKRVISIQHADAVSKDMHLVSDTIDLRFTDKVLSRSFSWGPSRAHATTPERDILADSIDVIMPGQVVHQMRAVGKAFATGEPDTTHFKSKERDWMKGDTIYAYFDTSNARPQGKSSPPAPPDRAAGKPPAAQGDGTGTVPKPAPAAADTQPEVRTLVSVGDAHAFYQLAPRDKTMKVPAINYVRGRVVTIQFEHRLVQSVDVIDNAAGVYLEPQADTISKDSARRAQKLTDTLPKPKKKRKGGKGAAASPPVPKADSSSVARDSSSRVPASTSAADTAALPAASPPPASPSGSSPPAASPPAGAPPASPGTAPPSSSPPASHPPPGASPGLVLGPLDPGSWTAWPGVRPSIANDGADQW
jgi:hypothetical protein